MRRLVRVAEEEIVLVIVLAAFAVVFLAVFPPHLLVNDSFLTLTGGREIAEHGLPSRDELTVIGVGRTWTDQQWGAQLLAYGVYELGGHALLAVLASLFPLTALVVSALASRSLGAGPRAFLLVLFPVIFAAAPAWTIRAQLFVLPLYATLVWLLLSEARRPTRRVYLALPLLLVWANLHGSVVLGAFLVVVFAVVELLVTRGRSLGRSALLLVLAPLMALATPYGPVETARYYRLVLIDPPFADRVTEWQWSDPAWNTLAFYVLAALALVVGVRCRRRLHPFDSVLLLVTFAGGVQALRGIQWFAFACLVVLPVAIGTSLEGARAPVRRRLNRTLVAGVSAVAVVVVAIAFVRDASWYERRWPNEALDSVRAAGADPARLVFATDRQSDWLLWKLPELRGRVAYDVRFEIYEPSLFDRLTAYYGRSGKWKKLVDGYAVVVVDEKTSPSHTDDFLAEPGSRLLYRDEVIAVVLRRARS